MLSLNDRKWKEFRVGDLFEFTRGKRITTVFASENTGNIPVIAGGESNNGILCYLDERCKKIRVLKESCITVAAYGTAGCVHYHGYKCFIDDKALALNIKDKDYDNRYVNLFLVSILRTLQSRYSYGRGVTIDRYGNENINIPINENGSPDYDFMEQYVRERVPDYSWVTGCFKDVADLKLDNDLGKLQLTDREWKEFYIGDLFDIEQGKGKVDKDTVVSNGIYNIATASTINNGIIYSNSEQDAKIRSGNNITIGRQTGIAFYQANKYFETDNILILSSNKLDENIGKFIAAIYNESLATKFSYGRVASIGKLRSELIRIPIDCDGNPDYNFMQHYIVERERVVIQALKVTMNKL